jgi:tRNA(adenine34) deaminase
MEERHKYFMQIALNEAKKAEQKGEIPIGAVIVLNDTVISKNHNRVEELSNSTAHAELLAIQEAVKIIGYKHLLDATLYVTLEPCSMCAGAIVLARIKRLVFATHDSKSGACGSVLNIVQNPKLNHKVEILSGILENESSILLKTFFKQLRSKDNE